MSPPVVFAGLLPHAPILLPGVGGRETLRLGASVKAMQTVATRALAARPDTVVLISPHSPRRPVAFGLWFTPRLRGSLERFGSPEDSVDLPLDRAFAERLKQEALQTGPQIWEITHGELDHGAVVPLCYLAAAGWKGTTIILSLNYPGDGGLDELGQAIVTTARILKRRVALIASGDMSHRLTASAPAGYNPAGKRFDETFIHFLSEGRFGDIKTFDAGLQDNAAEDAVDSTRVALAATDYRTDAHHEVLSYEGPFGVGYGVAILYETGKDEPLETPSRGPTDNVISHLAELPGIARRAVTEKLKPGAILPPCAAHDEAAMRGAVFVTIRTNNGDLRGCCGVTTPTQKDLVAETWSSALAAAFHDSRFPAVTAAELPQLQFSVSVLGEFEPVQSVKSLDPVVYGVLVSTNDGRRALLLPGIEGIDAVETQLALVRRKGGIGPKEPVKIRRFTTVSFKEQSNLS